MRIFIFFRSIIIFTKRFYKKSKNGKWKYWIIFCKSWRQENHVKDFESSAVCLKSLMIESFHYPLYLPSLTNDKNIIIDVYLSIAPNHPQKICKISSIISRLYHFNIEINFKTTTIKSTKTSLHIPKTKFHYIIFIKTY